MNEISKFLDTVSNKKARLWLWELLKDMSNEIMQNCKLNVWKKGDKIIQAGDYADSVYFLIDGSVRLMNELPNGIIYSFAILHTTAILGETEAFGKITNYRGSVVCETDCKTLYIPQHIFLKWMKESPESLYRITVEVILKTTTQTSRDRAFLFFSGQNRLVYQLAKYYEEKAENGVCVLTIPRYQLADEIGFSVKTVNRCIAKLKKKNLINQKGKQITITKENYESLKKFLIDAEFE